MDDEETNKEAERGHPIVVYCHICNCMRYVKDGEVQQCKKCGDAPYLYDIP